MVTPSGVSSASPPEAGINPASLQKLTRSLTRGKIKLPPLSNILTNAALATSSETTFAAFKVLPIDPARMRRGSSTGGNVEYTEAADELSGASSCQEAVGLIVDCIRKAREDIGGAHDKFVRFEDVVRWAESTFIPG